APRHRGGASSAGGRRARRGGGARELVRRSFGHVIAAHLAVEFRVAVDRFDRRVAIGGREEVACFRPRRACALAPGPEETGALAAAGGAEWQGAGERQEEKRTCGDSVESGHGGLRSAAHGTAVRCRSRTR